MMGAVFFPPTVHGEGSLYTACRDQFFTILAINHFFLGVGVLPNHPLICQLSSHHHLPVLAVPFLITKQRKLFCLLVHYDIPICNSVGIVFLLSLTVCTLWFKLILPAFGWYVILAGHFPQKSLNKNPRISFHFSPPLDHTFSYL